MISPTHRYLAVRTLVTNNSARPQDALMGELYDFLLRKPCSPEVTYAWELFTNAEHRPTLDAFLVTKAPHDLIDRVLGIPVAVVDAYAHLFLDVSALRNRLEVLSYVAAYEGNAHGKELLRTAVTVGVEYLLWLHGVAPEVEPRTVVRRTMTDAFFRGMAHRGNSLASNVAKEAHKWWSMAIRNAELLEKIDPRATRAAYEELRIALEAKDETLSPTASPVPLDQVLH